jgi:hypothetical protein
MHRGWRQFGVPFLAVLWLTLNAWPQVQVGDNTKLGLDANAMFGYDKSFGTGTAISSSNLDFGFDGNLTGNYYNPNFLSFRISPYYNQSRVNSDFNSIFGAKGVDATANLFSGGRTPIAVSYGVSFNSEQQLNVPGSVASYAARGDAQNLNINAGLLLNNLPTLNVAYGLGRSNYDILGSNLSGSGSSRLFGVGSSYNVWGFGMYGSYFDTHMSQNLPDLVDLNHRLNLITDQKTAQVGATRHLWDSANLNVNFSRNHLSTESVSTPTDVRYDNFGGTLSMKPVHNMMLNIFVNYTTNLSALLLSSILPTSASSTSNGSASSFVPTGQAALAVSTSTSLSSDYLDYGARGTYSITRNLTASGGADRRFSNFENLHAESTTGDGGLGYSHQLFGGQFGAHYGFSISSSSIYRNNQYGNSAGISFSHSVFGWEATGGAQYIRNTAASLLSYTQSGFSFNANASRRLAASWRLSLGANFMKNRIDQLQPADSHSSNYSASISGNRFSFGGDYSRSNGNSLQTLGGLVPIGGVPIPIPTLLVLYSGTSYAMNAAYHPTRRFHIWTDYSHARYSTSNAASLSDSLLTRYDLRSEYFFRQLHFEAGYSHITQGIGAGFATPASINALYVGVTRHFDIF